MESDRKFIWVKLIWTVVVIFFVALLFYIRHTKVGGIIGFGIYPYLLSPYTLGLSFLLILLRLIIPAYIRRSFVYLFAGTISILLGVCGIYLDAYSPTEVNYIIHAIFYLNFLLAMFIFFDALKK